MGRFIIGVRKCGLSWEALNLILTRCVTVTPFVLSIFLARCAINGLHVKKRHRNIDEEALV